MSAERGYPEDGVDAVSIEELLELRNKNLEAAEAHYQDEARSVRAAALSKLLGYNALGVEFGWVFFELDPQQPQAQQLGLQGKTEILLLAQERANKNPTDLLHVRIITNEEYPAPQGTLELSDDGERFHRPRSGRFFYSDHIMIDYENDTTYYTDAIFVSDTGIVDKSRTLAPLIFLSASGKMMYDHLPPWPPLHWLSQEGLNICEDQDKDTTVTPLGHFKYLHDKLDALDKMKNYLAAIRDLEPKACHEPPATQP